jgi:hypothetical protein
VRANARSFVCAVTPGLAAVGVLVSAATAAADPPVAAASLTYERQSGAEACPDEPELREQVKVRLGYDPFQNDAPHRVSVRIAPHGKGLRARIQTSDASATPNATTAVRELDGEGDGCDELLQSVVLAVSLAIDPRSFAGPRAAPLPPSPVAPEPPLLPSKAPVAAPPPSSPSASPWTIQIDAAARIGFGLVPNVSLGPVVDVRVGQRRWALVAEAGADLPTSSRYEAGSSGPGVQASLLRGGLGACGILAWLSLCGRVDFGALEGSGTGMTVATTATTFYADVALGAGLDVPIASGIHAIARAEMLAPLTRTPLEIGMAHVWTAPTLAGSFALGVGYRF